MIQDIKGFGVEHKVVDTIFDRIITLIQSVNDVNVNLINNSENASTIEILNCTSNYVIDRIKEQRTQYKRQKSNELDPFYVKPISKSIRTRIEMKRDKKTISPCLRLYKIHFNIYLLVTH